MIPKLRFPTPPMAPWANSVSQGRILQDPPMHDKNPWSDGLRAYREEVLTVGMLLDDVPIVCSCCLGTGRSKGIFFKYACMQCKNTGYDWIGAGTLNYFNGRRR